MTKRPTEKAQRLRVRFARGPEAGTIGHLEMARCWLRAFESAGLIVSHTDGNRPRLTVAAGLPMSVTSEGELLDVVLAARVPPADVAERVRRHLPDGLDGLDVWEVGMGLPALPSSVRWADFEVDVPVERGADVGAAIGSLLAAGELPWEDTRGEKVRRYDLRPLVKEISIVKPCDGAVRLRMRLRCDASGVGRADQVVKALGLPEATRIHRLRLALSEPSPARDAWRRRGRFL